MFFTSIEPAIAASSKLALRSASFICSLSRSASNTVFKSNDRFFNWPSWLANGSIPATLKRSARSFPLTSSLPFTAGLSDIILLAFMLPDTSRPRPVSASRITSSVCLSRFALVFAVKFMSTGEFGICLPANVALICRGVRLMSLRFPLTPASTVMVFSTWPSAAWSNAVSTPVSWSPLIDKLPSILPLSVLMSLASNWPLMAIPSAFAINVGTLILPVFKSASNSVETSKALLGTVANCVP